MPPVNSPAGGVAPPNLGSISSETSLSQLRTLLLGASEEQLEAINARLGNSDLRVKELSQDLPAALIHRAQKDNKLAQALLKTVEGIIQTSVERDPQPIVNAIYPAIAPALRRAVNQALRQMMGSMNQTLDHSLSLKGLKWRIEAWRTGRSFAEVVMLNSLLFRVEQLFLIEWETGLLLRHVTADDVKGEDPDIVSGMLTAIRDFAHDSFRLNKEESLASVEIGDREIFVVQGPKAVLAAIVWGTPPDNFRKVLNEVLEEIHLTCAGEFKEKEADPLAFEKVDPVLQRALLVEERSDTQRAPMITWLLLFGLAALIVYGGYVWWAQSQIWSDFKSRLDQEPGIVITSAERNWGSYTIRGLRDPLAMDPNQLAADVGIDPGKIESQWEPYQALTPPIIIARAQKLSSAPETVQFAFDQGVLKLSGKASNDWGKKASAVLIQLTGVDQLDDTRLILYSPLELILEEARDLLAIPDSVTLGISGDRITILGEAQLEWFKQFDQLFREQFKPQTLDVTQLIISEQKELQKVVAGLAGEKLYFTDGGAELVAGDGLGPIPMLAKYIGQLSELADLLGQPLRIEIKGKTDIRGSAEYNHALSVRRAETIRNRLIENGVPAKILIASGQSVEELLRLKQRGYMDENDRRVEFTVINK